MVLTWFHKVVFQEICKLINQSEFGAALPADEVVWALMLTAGQN
jgi:hypothetical protein